MPRLFEFRIFVQFLLCTCRVVVATEVVRVANATETSVRRIVIPHKTVKIGGRWVVYQTPCSHPELETYPDVCHGYSSQAGKTWPVAVLFHGWNLAFDEAHGRAGGWNQTTDDYLGLFNKARTIRALLQKGIAVVAPNAADRDDGWYWDTNQAPFSEDLRKWPESGDFSFLQHFFEEIWKSSNPPEGQVSAFGGGLDINNIHIVGFSSGGFMASRMAFSPVKLKNQQQIRFQTITICSGSYYWRDGSGTVKHNRTQDGPFLNPRAHPPTLFLHGLQDETVPANFSEEYHKDLLAHGVESSRQLQNDAYHQWLDFAPKAIAAWILKHQSSSFLVGTSFML